MSDEAVRSSVDVDDQARMRTMGRRRAMSVAEDDAKGKEGRCDEGRVIRRARSRSGGVWVSWLFFP